MEDRTPTDGDARQADAPDLLVGEIQRARRDRRVLVVAAVIGIITGALFAVGFMLDAIGGAAGRARVAFRPATLSFVLGPPLVSVAIGYAIYAVRRRRRRG